MHSHPRELKMMNWAKKQKGKLIYLSWTMYCITALSFLCFIALLCSIYTHYKFTTSFSKTTAPLSLSRSLLASPLLLQNHYKQCDNFSLSHYNNLLNTSPTDSGGYRGFNPNNHLPEVSTRKFVLEFCS